MAGLRGRLRWDLLLWAPVAAAAIDLLVLVVQGRRLVGALYTNSDVVSAPVIASLSGEAPDDAQIILASYPWYEPFWFMRATEWLPAHREVWEGAPFVFAAVGIGAVAWMAWRVFGPWAAAMTGALLAATNTGMRSVLFTHDSHGPALIHAALLGAALVFVVHRRERLSGRALVVLGVVLAAFTALGEPDRLLLASGIIPFAVAGTLGWWLTGQAADRRVAIWAVCVAGGAAIGGEAFGAVMRHDHIVQSPVFHLNFAAYDHLSSYLELMVGGFAFLGGGDFWGARVQGKALFAFASGALVLTAGLLVLRWAWDRVPALLRDARDRSPEGAVRRAYLAFWGVAVVAVPVAFVLSSSPTDLGNSRYLSSAFVGVAALIPALALGSWRGRVLLAAGATAFCLLTVRTHIVDGPGRYGTDDAVGPVNAIRDFAESRGLKYGYAGYQEAPLATWTSHLRLQVFPVWACQGDKLCPFPTHSISSWYRPRPATRTFLIARPPGGFVSVGGAYAAAGKPVETRSFGPLVVYVYDHDIAADLG